MEDWQKLSVLVAGCGSIGRRHLRVLRELGVRDFRACDPSGDARHAVGDYVPQDNLWDDYRSALESEPDAVFVCTPPDSHVPMAMEALRSRCHVFMEKPVSHAWDGVDELATQAEQSSKKLMLGLCFRYHEGVKRLREQFDTGRIGRLICVRAMVGEYLPDIRPDYRDQYVAKCNGAFELMHDLDLALWFAGQPVRRVHSVFGGYSDIGISAPDLVELLMQFEDRCTASVHVDFFQRPRRRLFELIGIEGVMTLEFARWERCTVSVWDASRGAWEHDDLETDRDNMFRAEDQEFLAAAAGDLPIVCTLQEGLRSLRVILAAQR